jgi:TrmH family RNA methyltransferase
MFFVPFVVSFVCGELVITSTSNSRIKEARKLHQRRYRRERGLLLIEGVRLVQDAVEAGVEVRLAFYVPQLEQTNPSAARTLDHLRASGVESLACTPEVFASFSETMTPQGIAAIVELPELPLPTPSTLALILDGVRDPGNAGTLLRSAEAAGADLVLFGPETVDPFNEKVVRAGMGAHFRLPLRVCPTWDAVQRWLDPEQTLYLAEAKAKLAYDAVDWRRPAALIVGGEAAGVSAAARQRAQPIAIPMQGHVESLNAAMAGSIILFEAARQRRVER